MAISRSFPLFMVLSWIYNASMVIKSIVHEKELRLKEVMKVMGLSNSVLWSSWFIESFSFFTLSSFLLVLILHFGKVLTYSDPFIVYIFLILYSISVITSCFTISTLFGKANVAAAGGGMIFFMTYLPYTFLILWEELLFPYEKAIGCLFPNVAFGFGCSYLAHFEEEGVGIQWSNIGSSPIANDNFNMLYVFSMLIVDSFLNILMTVYIEAVFPGQFGVPKPFYFFLMPSYWCENKKTILKDERLLTDKNEKNVFIEEEPKDLKLGISISKLSKVYSGGKVAVDNLSLNFYEGQITSFLGHNGAGKTTTISILTGLFPPTSGTAWIYGHDITTEMDTIRHSLGTCPQYNVLFGHLTVAEHLWFYASLKGAGPEVQKEIDVLIDDLGLSHKRDEFSTNLSGGMQRKLSIAIAFVGGSRTVILDEPTAGVDPYSRRSIWELLIKYKAGRTVILTTHHMDEADLLGDRIAVIGNGKLRCVGSSLFLKSKFGSGYYLTFVTKSNSNPKLIQENSSPNPQLKDNSLVKESNNLVVPKEETRLNHSSPKGSNDSLNSSQKEVNLIITELTDFIHRYIPNAQMIEKVGSELTYLLPTNSQESGSLQNLLRELDDKLVDLNVVSYGISDTPLEEVFLRVTGTLEEDLKKSSSLEEAVESLTDGGRYPSRLRLNSSFCNNLARIFQPSRYMSTSNGRNRNDKLDEHIPGRDECNIPMKDLKPPEKNPLTSYRIQGWDLKKRQFWALQRKRFHHTRRNYRSLLCEIVLPALLICVAMLFTLIVPPIMEEPQLELKPWLYGPPNYIFFNDDSLGKQPVRKYIDELTGDPGIGTKCVQGIPEKYRKLKPQLYAFSSVKRSQWSESCDAEVTDRNLTSPYNLTVVNQYQECDCSSGTQECPEPVNGFEPPSTPIISGDILFNATGRNISDWLVKTSKQYYKKRYGGYSFGYSSSIGSFNYTSIERLFFYLLDLAQVTDNRENIERTITNLTSTLERAELWNNVKVWFNNKGWAASVSYLNAINNVILRANLPENVDKRYYGITVINHPMNFTKDQLRDEMFRRGGLSLLHSITVLFAMSFVPASFVLYLIEDRISGSKHLQFVSGVNPNVYWISTFIWDMVNYLIPTFLCLIIFIAFNAEAYIKSPNIYAFITLLILYGFASIPLMYPTVYLFKVPSSAFVVLSSINLFIGTVSTVATFVLELFDDDELQLIGNKLKVVFLIFPQYCLGRGLLEMSANHLASRAFAKFGVSFEKNPFEFSYIGRNMLALFIQGIIFFALILWFESGILSWRMRKPKAPNVDDDEEDDDVASERERILGGFASEYPLRLENLTKIYQDGQIPAVNKLWMSVAPGECFGLLGVNGAGKTSTFKMLTGEIKISSGEAFIAGFRVKNELTKARQHIGYCPQFDALDPFLTGWEHLELYSRLRGIPEEKIKKVVRWSIKKLGLYEYSNVVAGSYSGGNKRKLSTAIALVGQPSVVFLDEPTTGMDPKARRFLWNCIIDIVKDKCAVVLTSHSMEECEALCTRLAVMVNGRFRCLGSTQHLKNKFGEGYMVTLRVGRGEECKGAAQSFIDGAFGGEASLKEVHLNQMEYQIGSKIRITSIFSELEKSKNLGIVSDYSVTQTTLDQVFIRFARNQKDQVKQSKSQSI